MLRECAAVRTNVGFLDGSTLGKIDVQGPDAGSFLDLIYTNLMSSLKVGMIRYGVMCWPDGMIIDDGTAIRLAEDRYLITTTTGNAAKILDWLEEWHQTEWPHFDVAFTSVTEQWATMALAGPDLPLTAGRACSLPGRRRRALSLHGLAKHHAWPDCRPASAGSPSRASWLTRSTSPGPTRPRCGTRSGRSANRAG